MYINRMHDLLLDVADSMFSASSTFATSEPHFARMLDLSIFARNAFVPSTSAVGRFISLKIYIRNNAQFCHFKRFGFI